MNCEKFLSSYNVLRKIGEIADDLGLETYVVGGAVRDFFLDRKSKNDLDIVCVGSGIALAKAVAEKLNSTEVSEFKNFGTAMIKIANLEIEFVGARKESYNRLSRKPMVEDGTLQDDQNRRDFTVNALAISINKATWGKLINSFDGLKDLENKILRTPLEAEQTFSDDPLRMMRAIRFAVQLNMQIDSNCINAIKNISDRIKIVSAERISTELNKMILSEKPSRAFYLMDETNLLEKIFPEFCLLKGTEKFDHLSHKENFVHTLQVLDNIALHTEKLWLRWAAILHDIAKPQTKKFEPGIGFSFHNHEFIGAKMVPGIFSRLKLPLNEHMKYVQKLVKLHLRPIVLANDFITDAAIRRLVYDAGDDIDDLMMLCRADVTSKNDNKVKKYLANFDKIEEKIKIVEEKDKIRNFQPAITGQQIMEMFRLSPCPLIGELKNSLKDAILDGEIDNNYEDSYNYIVEKAKSLGLELFYSDK